VDYVVLGITPFQYNPVTRELVVYRDLRVRVTFSGGNGHFGDDRLRSRYWEPLLQSHLLNYASLPTIDFDKRMREQTDEDNCEYLIIVPDDPTFIAWADSIKQFRTQQGIITGITTLTEIGGNDWTAIYNYMITAYWVWSIPPVAVLLLGDHENSGGANPITSHLWDNYCVSDNKYVDVMPDDLPDMAISRIPANDGGDLATMVGKFLDYERTPPTDPNFYDHPIIAGGWQEERWFIPCTEIIYGYLANELGKNPVREYAIYEPPLPTTIWSTATNTNVIVAYFGPAGLQYIPATPEYLWDWGGNATRINADINAGAFILQHRDHGYEYGWGEPAYSVNSLTGLSNTMLPFVFSTNCCTGNFSLSNQCLAEGFYNMQYGAVGVNAASEVSYSFVNDTYQWGVYDSMWPDFDPGYGVDSTGSPELRTCFANASGKYYLEASSWPYNVYSKTVTYHLLHHFGDAFLTLYSEVPQALTVEHPAMVNAEITEFPITATTRAMVALTVGEEIIGVTEATGSPQTISISPRSPGETILVTATLQNYNRYSSEVDVITEQPHYVVYEDLTINDASGNNNQLLDLGEDVTLSITLKNIGTQTATNIQTRILCNDDYIVLIDSMEIYPSIASLSTTMIPDGFEIATTGNVPDLHEIAFTMGATDGDSTWLSPFSITAHAPVVVFDGLFIDDASGNGNDHLDPGETADFQITLYNEGSGYAEDLTVLLATDNPLITIPQNSGILAYLDSDSSGVVLYASIAADSSITPEDSANFTLDITTPGGYITRLEFGIMVGDSRYVPSGPDAYGYYAYDEYDGLDAPDYDWVEIATPAGGNGIELDLSVLPFTLLDLPFSFRFYGVDYDKATINANGWVSFDTTETFFPQNLPIPDALPPNRLIAAFWDYMAYASGGQVFYLDDAANHRFIVEWYQMPHSGSLDSVETFEVILLDPAYYPSVTGDGEIIVHYHSLSSLLNGCTVGIEDLEGAVGLEYLYNGTYDSLAIPLEDQFSVKFTTGSLPLGVEGSVSVTLPEEYYLTQNYPNPFNPQTTISFGLPKTGQVRLSVYDLQGRRVATLVDGERAAGVHRVTFDGSSLASGIYLTHMSADGFAQTRKMILVK
jgi:hypothetical protein